MPLCFKSKLFMHMCQRFERRFRNQSFKCGQDNDGDNVKIKMKYYVSYMRHNQDDAPLYVFDGVFDEVFQLVIV